MSLYGNRHQALLASVDREALAPSARVCLRLLGACIEGVLAVLSPRAQHAWRRRCVTIQTRPTRPHVTERPTRSAHVRHHTSHVWHFATVLCIRRAERATAACVRGVPPCTRADAFKIDSLWVATCNNRPVAIRRWKESKADNIQPADAACSPSLRSASATASRTYLSVSSRHFASCGTAGAACSPRLPKA